MAREVYVFTKISSKSARYDLTKEERDRIVEKIRRAMDDAGGKSIASFQSLSPVGGKWGANQLHTFPDVEAYAKFINSVCNERGEIQAAKYWELDVTIGYKPEDS